MTDKRHTEEVRRENLDKLATYLENLPADYKHFNMGDFLGEDYGNRDKVLDYARNNGGVHKCGTAACAVGHGPAAGILFDEDEIRENTAWNFETDKWEVLSYSPEWKKYTERFCDFGYDEFEFLFGGDWVVWDDTHQGAAARIRYYLAHGVPEAFIDSWDYEEATETVQDFMKTKVVA